MLNTDSIREKILGDARRNAAQLISDADVRAQKARAASETRISDARTQSQRDVEAQADELRARCLMIRSWTSPPRSPTTNRHGWELPADGARPAAASRVSTCALDRETSLRNRTGLNRPARAGCTRGSRGTAHCAISLSMRPLRLGVWRA